MIKDQNQINQEFIAEKSLKITKAIYLVTDHLAVHEPLKWNLRELAIKYIKDKEVGSELIDFLEIAEFSKLISPLNIGQIIKEINGLDELNKSAAREPLLSHSFFEVLKDKQALGLKDTGKNTIGQNLSVKTKGVAHFHQELNSKLFLPSSRRERIINLAKKKGTFSIKDISGEAQDLSEKTIQRELLELVRQGILEKEGERRWSRYTIAI